MTRHPTPTNPQLPPPTTDEAEVDVRIQVEITTLRDQILGSQRPDEDLETYRLRSYQALRQATEIIHSNHSPEIDLDEDEETGEDPVLASYHSKLDLIATTLNRPIDE